jgi:hypothetical protein
VNFDVDDALGINKIGLEELWAVLKIGVKKRKC